MDRPTFPAVGRYVCLSARDVNLNRPPKILSFSIINRLSRPISFVEIATDFLDVTRMFRSNGEQRFAAMVPPPTPDSLQYASSDS